MAAGAGLTLFRIRGIRIAVDFSWFFVLFLVILWLSGFYRDVLGTSSEAVGPYLLALISALLFFASILLHELGHALVAVRKGIGIADITLWMFGGVARMQRDSDSPGTEFKIAIAGPLVTLAIVLISGAIGIAFAGGSDFSDAMMVEEGAQIPGALAVVAWLTSINLLVLVFNLIPAYPLDGGRIARAGVWKVTGDRARATRLSGYVGQGFAVLLIGFGIFLAFSGNPYDGIWLAVLGYLLGQSARSAVMQTEVTSRLDGVTVADIMDAEPVTLPAELPVQRAYEDFFLRYQGWPWFAVVEPDGRYAGIAHRAAVESAALEHSEVAVRDLAADTAEVRDDAPLEALLGSEPSWPSTPTAACAGSSRSSRSRGPCRPVWHRAPDRRRPRTSTALDGEVGSRRTRCPRAHLQRGAFDARSA